MADRSGAGHGRPGKRKAPGEVEEQVEVDVAVHLHDGAPDGDRCGRRNDVRPEFSVLGWRRIGHVPGSVITDYRSVTAARLGFYSNPRAVRN